MFFSNQINIKYMCSLMSKSCSRCFHFLELIISPPCQILFGSKGDQKFYTDIDITNLEFQ